MNRFATIAAGLSLACAGLLTASADPVEPECFPHNMIDNQDTWFQLYNASTFMVSDPPPGDLALPIGAPIAEWTHQHAGAWDKLITFGTTEPIHIWSQPFVVVPGGEGDISEVTIQNPVLILTLDTSDWSAYLPKYDSINQRWVFRPASVYNQGQDLFGSPALPTVGTPWMSAHQVESISPDGTATYVNGTALGYLDRLPNMNREELNPAIGVPGAAINAASLAPPGVGMPWTFNQALLGHDPPSPFPWNGGGASWWQQRFLVFIADRDAFVRPSFNPSLREETGSYITHNGIPMWNGERYAFPEQSDVLYTSYKDATDHFVGLLEVDGTLKEYRGPKAAGGLQNNGFQGYLEEWKALSWTPPPSDWTQITDAVGFPFSGLGLTLNWARFCPEDDDFTPGDLSSSFGAVSEFIHSDARHPIYLVGTLDPYQYMGKPVEGQVPWCDTCIADFNRDGFVDVSDLLELINHWDSCQSYECLESRTADWPMQYNIDKESPYIDVQDLLELLHLWGECEWPLDWRPEDCLPAPN